MLYSAFDTKLGANFTFNLLGFILIAQVATIYRFYVYDRENQTKTIFEGSQYSISSKIFGDWDWNIKTEKQMHIQTSVTYKAVHFEIDREKIHDLIN